MEAVLATGPAHGYAVIEALRQGSGGQLDLPEGSVYPALHRLEGDRLVASQWEEVTGRRRRVYRLTARGNAALSDRRGEWRVFSHAVDSILLAGGGA